MTEIVFESNKGIIFERTLYKSGIVELAVKNKAANYTITHYRYKHTKSHLSPYLSWDNLNCCDGWNYDEEYLYSAVQEGKKLYAGIAFHIGKDDVTGQALPPGFYTEKEVADKIEMIESALPGDCVMGIERPDSERYMSVLRYVYICKSGAIHDYINVAGVFDAYKRFGVMLDGKTVDRVRELCAMPIRDFASNTHMDYANPAGTAELIVTGLLLGYPIETTASMIEAI